MPSFVDPEPTVYVWRGLYRKVGSLSILFLTAIHSHDKYMNHDRPSKVRMSPLSVHMDSAS